MTGHHTDGVHLAHADSWAGSGSKLLLPREAREATEHAFLAVSYTHLTLPTNREV